MEEARQSSMAKTATALSEFTRSLNTFAQERITMLNSDDFEQSEKINRHYNLVIIDLTDRQDEFMNKTLPAYFCKADNYPAGGDAYKLYYKTIDSVTAGFTASIDARIKQATEQQRMLIEGNQEIKKQIIASTQKIVEITMLNSAKMLEQSPVFKELNQQIKSDLFSNRHDELPYNPPQPNLLADGEQNE